jgi:hypothetical protein
VFHKKVSRMETRWKWSDPFMSLDRPRPPRRSYFAWSAPNASIRCNSLSSVASTLNWVVTRRLRVLLSYSRCYIFLASLLSLYRKSLSCNLFC